MGIAPRQIGWSNESNLLWNISKQLEKLNGVVAATAAGGMLNPTTNYIPFNSGLAFGDSYLVNDSTNSVLKTVYSGNDVGLNLDFVGQVYRFGDYNFISNGSYLFLDSGLQYAEINTASANLIVDGSNWFIKTQYNNNDIGLKLDFASNTFTFGDDVINNNFLRFTIGANSNAELSTSFASIGDVFSLVNGTTFNVEDNNQIIKSTYGGADVGLKLDFANGIYTFGDFNTNPTGNFIYIDYTGLISTQNVFNGSEGIVLDMGNRNFLLGDPGNINGTHLVIDDANQVFSLSGNLSANTAGASSGQFLKVRIGGVDYKIALLNNA